MDLLDHFIVDYQWLSQFQISFLLSSPTSTTIQIAVAIKFSGTKGMIIKLDNPDENAQCELRGFDCSMISRFKEEDERYTLL